MAGALLEEVYLEKMKAAGFKDVSVIGRRTYSQVEAKAFVKSVEEEKKKKGKSIDKGMVLQACLSVANDRIVAYKLLNNSASYDDSSFYFAPDSVRCKSFK